MSQPPLPPPPPPLPPPPGPIPPPPLGPDGRARWPRATWSPLEALAGGVVAFVMSQLLVALVLILTGTIDQCGPRNALGLLASEVGLGATVYIWVRSLRKTPISALGLPGRPVRDIGFGVVSGVALYVTAIAASLVVVAISSLVLGHQPTEPSQVESCLRGGWLYAFAVIAVLGPPIGEEPLFRGFLYNAFRRRWSFLPASLFSGLLFGAVHIPFFLIVPSLVVVGMGLAFVYERRQSLVASMAAHATFNLIGVIAIMASRH